MPSDTVWLDPSFLEGDRFLSGWREERIKEARRAHELWRHSQTRLNQASTPEDLVDVIAALKRAVDHRLRLLNDIYRFKHAPVGSASLGLLERLAAVGLIKPRMLAELIAIRNQVEHQDAPPPPAVRVEELAEVAWYFLASTDSAVGRIPDHLQLYYPHNGAPQEYVCTVSVAHHAQWRLHFDGTLPSAMVSRTAREGWYLVADEPRVVEGDEGSVLFDVHVTRRRFLIPQEDGVRVDGRLLSDSPGIARLLTRYFEIY